MALEMAAAMAARMLAPGATPAPSASARVGEIWTLKTSSGKVELATATVGQAALLDAAASARRPRLVELLLAMAALAAASAAQPLALADEAAPCAEPSAAGDSAGAAAVAPLSEIDDGETWLMLARSHLSASMMAVMLLDEYSAESAPDGYTSDILSET